MRQDRGEYDSGTALKAPFPYFGGKRLVAGEVWRRFGDVPNYVEPFFGSGAVLLARPPFEGNRIETVNDLDGHVCNFWRALQADPDAVAAYADWPVNELDLHARGDWLYYRPSAREWVEQLRADPEFYDAKSAGWWVWFVSSWIGSLPAIPEDRDGITKYGRGSDAGKGVNRKLPHLENAGKGVNRKLPHLGDAGAGVNRKLPHLGDAGKGVNRKLPHLSSGGQGVGVAAKDNGIGRRAHLTAYMRFLAARMERVRVCCGDWSRVTGPSVTWKHGVTGVFLDPPYSAEAGRDNQLYSVESLTVAHDVREWAIENGDNPLMRIALCGYDGEGHEALEAHGWQPLAWKAHGGYGSQGNGRGRTNAGREVVWFSPHCLNPVETLPLFAHANGNGQGAK